MLQSQRSPIYTLLASFALGKCWDITGQGDGVGRGGTHDGRAAEIDGYPRSCYSSLLADRDKEQQSPLPGARGRFKREENKICLTASAGVPADPAAKLRCHGPEPLPGTCSEPFPPNRCRKCSRSSPGSDPATASGAVAEPTWCLARPSAAGRASPRPLGRSPSHPPIYQTCPRLRRRQN